MKKLIFALAIAILASCSTKAPELQVPRNDVEFTGNGFQLFSVVGDVKLFAVEGADKLWTLKASVPLRKADKTKISNVAMGIDLLDRNDAPVHGSDRLVAIGLEDILPVFNSAEGVEKNVVFASEIPLPAKSVKTILDQTVAVNLSVATDSKSAASSSSDAPTLSSLLQKYGCWGLFSQYDRACRNDNEDLQDRIEDKLDDIVDLVKKDYTVSKGLAERFEDYIEDKLDEIEDRY